MIDPAWTDDFVTANGIRVHYLRHGAGNPIVLLHGWPEFCRVWRRNIGPLAAHFDVVVPDLRGFGDSEKPDLSAKDGYTLDHLVDDLEGLADALGLDRFGVVGHDIGAYVMQGLARKRPERLVGLFFFDCPYPGIGKRWGEAEHIKEIWYQTFHTLPWAAEMVGSSRRACELYFRHFLDHWAYRPGSFEAEDVAAWVDNYLKPGNLQGGFNWYVNSAPRRLELMRDGAPDLPKIDVPTRVRWGEGDAVLNVAWADRLGDYFSDLDFAPFPRAGHFAMYEQADAANREIIEFFTRVFA